MIRVILFFATLFAFWLLLSGNYKLWMIASGAAASALVVAFSIFKGVTDSEGFPVERLPRAIAYWIWLVRQIALSALNVTRLILDPRLPISPAMVRAPAHQGSSVGIVTYANSITLTPGTISVEVSEPDQAIWVHALTRENAAGFAEDEMDARVVRMEGSR